MTIEEKMREEFEAWDRENYGSYDGDQSKDEWGNYEDTIIQQCWEAWKASRESLVIELPEMIGMNQQFTGTPISEIRAHNHFNDAIQKCRKSIHAAGVKTK